MSDDEGVDRNGDGYIDMWIEPTRAVLGRLDTVAADITKALEGAPATTGGIGAGPLGTAFKAVISKGVDEVKAAAAKVPPLYVDLAGKGRNAVQLYVTGDAVVASTLSANGGEG